ncbi:MAG: hypothetical protein Q8N76_05305, partial [Candidatus Omnitrophota bacterium]|nr:hypothetical protein [Candidatus Omnitrophota bacterium]
MKKRNKIINIALIFILVGVFLWVDVVYSFNISCLRVSMDMPEMKRRQERLTRRIEVSKFLESVDSAPSDRKARLVINVIRYLNQTIWKNKKHDISEKKLDQIKDKHSRFLRLYTRQYKLPLSLQGYVSIDCKSLVRIADDMYAAVAFINTKMHLLTLPKSGDFRLIPVGSESEIKG